MESIGGVPLKGGWWQAGVQRNEVQVCSPWLVASSLAPCGGENPRRALSAREANINLPPQVAAWASFCLADAETNVPLPTFSYSIWLSVCTPLCSWIPRILNFHSSAQLASSSNLACSLAVDARSRNQYLPHNKKTIFVVIIWYIIDHQKNISKH